MQNKTRKTYLRKKKAVGSKKQGGRKILRLFRQDILTHGEIRKKASKGKAIKQVLAVESLTYNVGIEHPAMRVYDLQRYVLEVCDEISPRPVEGYNFWWVQNMLIRIDSHCHGGSCTRRLLHVVVPQVFQIVLADQAEVRAKSL